jgi:hypothetical protein
MRRTTVKVVMPTYTFDSWVIIAHRVREIPKDFANAAS